MPIPAHILDAANAAAARSERWCSPKAVTHEVLTEVGPLYAAHTGAEHATQLRELANDIVAAVLSPPAALIRTLDAMRELADSWTVQR
jgi:hypothetical protein